MNVDRTSLNRVGSQLQDLLRSASAAPQKKEGQAAGSTIGSGYQSTIQRAKDINGVDTVAVARARQMISNGELETRDNITATARKILAVGL